MDCEAQMDMGDFSRSGLKFPKGPGEILGDIRRKMSGSLFEGIFQGLIFHGGSVRRIFGDDVRGNIRGMALFGRNFSEG